MIRGRPTVRRQARPELKNFSLTHMYPASTENYSSPIRFGSTMRVGSRGAPAMSLCPRLGLRPSLALGSGAARPPLAMTVMSNPSQPS